MPNRSSDRELRSDFYDALETRSRDEREAALFAALPSQIERARLSSPAYAARLRDVAPSAIADRAGLESLPVLKKEAILEAQRETPPMGGFDATPLRDMGWAFMSPGPIFEPGGGGDWWGAARAMHAAGFRRGMLVQNCFSYHFTPAGMMFESGAHALGCCVIPAGVGATELQVEAARALAPQAYAGTPDFLLTVLEKAEEKGGAPLDNFRTALVSGGPFFPSLAAAYRSREIEVRQAYGTAELGIVAYESTPGEGMIVNENLIVEILDPDSGTPVPYGDIGEITVTGFNRDYPLIRLATGDLSAFMEGESPCGRSNHRLRGWMGRADEAVKIRGMFVRPLQLRNALTALGIEHWRLEVTESDGRDRAALDCVPVEGADKAQIAAALAERCRVRIEIRTATEATLGEEKGKIVDRRSMP